MLLIFVDTCVDIGSECISNINDGFIYQINNDGDCLKATLNGQPYCKNGYSQNSQNCIELGKTCIPITVSSEEAVPGLSHNGYKQTKRFAVKELKNLKSVLL